jgi:hypothetical protein
LKPRIQFQDNPSKTFDNFKNITPNTHKKGNLVDNGMFGFDNEEPTPLPSQVPYFVGDKKFCHNTERKGVHKKEQVMNDEKYIRRVKGKLKPPDFIDKNKLENNKKRMYTRSPLPTYSKDDFSRQIKNSQNLKDQSYGIPNQKKALVKEVSVHLNSLKSKKYLREKSLPETYRTTQKDSMTGNYIFFLC